MYEQKMHPLYGEDERRGEILGNVRMVSSGFQNYYTCSPYGGNMSSMSPSNLSMHTQPQPQQQHQHNQGFHPIVDQRAKEKPRPGKFGGGAGLEFDGMTVLCRVCGDKASGFHYGVHSCEGCKGFFRRSIQQKIQYRPCMKNQQCSILRINRNRCQYCRLKKCIAVGMSRDAVRFGRVPKREKAKILAEMQRANQQSQLNALQAELDDEHKLINTIVQAHIETYEYTRQKMAALCENARRNPSYVQCPTQMACPLNPNPSGKGFKADSEMLEDFSERFTPAIRGVVEFAKRIPGFGILCQDDQVTLLKAGVFEVLLVRLACMFDSQTNTMMFVNGQMYKRELGQVKGNAGFLINSMFDFADRINSLQLTDAEVGLFCAVVLIAPDRPGIRNKDCVEKLQEKIIQGLHATIRSNHTEGPSLYTRLIMKLPDLKTLNSLHSEKLLAFKMEPTAPGVSSTTGEIEKPEPVIPTGQKLFNALTGMVRPPVHHPVPPYHLQSSFQLGLPPQNRYLYPPITAPAIQRPWEQVPKPFLSKEGSLSPQSMDMDSSEGSQVSPMSLDSLKKFEIHHVKREGDVLSDTSDGHSSLEHSPKNSENDVLDSSDRTGVELGSTTSNGAEYKQTDSDHSDRESPKSTHSVHSDSVLYKPHKKFRAHRLSDVGSPISQLNKKLEVDDGDIPDGLILRTPMDNVHSQYHRQEPPTSKHFPSTKENHPAQIAVPACPFPSNLSLWSDSHMSSQGVSNHNYINQAMLSGSQYPVRNFYPPIAQYPIAVPSALPAPKPVMSDIKCEPLNLSTKSSLGITQQGIPIKVEQTAS